MPTALDLASLERSYSAALTTYLEVLAKLDAALRTGHPAIEAVQAELQAVGRLEAARLQYSTARFVKPADRASLSAAIRR